MCLMDRAFGGSMKHSEVRIAQHSEYTKNMEFYTLKGRANNVWMISLFFKR